MAQGNWLRKQVRLDPWVASAAAGVAAGVAGGILARFSMRGVALLLGQNPGFSLEGTLGIIILFALAGVIVALPWTLVRLFVPWPQRTRALALAGTLAALLLPPLYGVATSDLPAGTPGGRIALLLLLFVPVPLGMGLLIELVGGSAQGRLARAGARTLPLGWALGLGALAAALFLSLFASLMGNLRHPALVLSILGGQSTSFEVAHGNARIVGLLMLAAYQGLALASFWRRWDEAPVRTYLLLLMATPLLLLSGEGALPLVLAWLPEVPWLIAALRAIGVALLLLLLLAAGGFQPPRWLWILCTVAWAALALWLVGGGNALPQWTEAMVWSMLALAFGAICTVRWRWAAGGTARWSAFCLSLFCVLWMGLWLAALLAPEWGLRSMSGFEIPLRVTLFWLPWLLLPAALWTVPSPEPALASRFAPR